MGRVAPSGDRGPGHKPLSSRYPRARAQGSYKAKRGTQAKTRVVVVDDSEIAAKLMEGFLEGDPGLQVIGRARTGAELLQLPALRAADVVVLDLLMPELAGLSVLRQLPKGCRAVAVSGDPEGSALAQAALAEGARGYVSKTQLQGPEAAQKLSTAIRAALESLAPSAPRAAAARRTARPARA